MKKFLLFAIFFHTLCTVMAIEDIKPYTFNQATMKFTLNNPQYQNKSARLEHNYTKKYMQKAENTNKAEAKIKYYEKILKNAKEFLNDGGHILFEIGINQACLVKELMEKYNFKNIEIYKDVTGIERVIKGNL